VHAWQAQVEDEQVEFGIGHQRRVGLGPIGHMVHRGA
jgi:hypothetical protein